MAMENYSRLKVTFDEVTGAMKLSNQEAVSLQKQVRLLRQELTLGSYTDAQFRQIQKALQETEVQLKQSQLRGKDLLQQIGTLGGGFGETANRIDNFIKLVGSLNQISLEEIQSQFRNLFLTFTGQADKISEVIDVAQTGGRPLGKRETSGNMGDAGEGIQTASAVVQAAGTKATLDAAKATEQFTKVLASNAAENYKVVQAVKENSNAVTKMAVDFANGEAKMLTAKQNMIEANKKEADLQASLVGKTKAEKKILLDAYNAEIAANMAAAKALQDYVKENKYALQAAKLLEKQFQNVSFVVEEGIIYIGYQDKALRALTDAENAAIISGKKLIITQEGMIAAEKELTVVQKIGTAITKGLTFVTDLYSKAVVLLSQYIRFATLNLGGFITSLRVADITAKITLATFTLLSAVVGGLLLGFQAFGPMVQYFTGFAKMAADAENLKNQLEAVREVLQLDLNDLKRRSSEERAVMEKNNATSAQLRQKDLKDAKSYYSAVSGALDEARQREQESQGNFTKARQINAERFNRLKEEFKGDDIAIEAIGSRFIAEQKRIKDAEKNFKRPGFFGVDKEAAEQQAKNVEAAGKLVLDLEQKQKDAANDINVKGNKNIEQTTKEGLNSRLKAIDAAIEQQIFKERTSSDELFKLYKERNSITDYLDKDHKLTQVERDERARIQKKKVNDAIIDDNLRVLQSNADIIARQIETVEKGSGEEYELRRKLAQANREIAFQEAKRDEKTRENNEKNANTKLAKDLLEIDKMYWKDKMELRQTELNSLYEGTAEFYDKERELEQESYRLKIVEARNNAKLIEAINEEHKRRLLEIDAKEIQNKSQMLARKSETEFFAEENIGLRVREINKKIYDDKVLAENTNYEAEVIRAGTNNQLLEQLYLEHNQRLAQISAQRIETEQQINLQIEQLGVQFGQTLSNIGNVILADAQGRDEKKFKQAKKIAVAGVGIEKASAIASIWTNNYIANAKARAAFFATNGQPFVTINTISAILNTAATVAAAAQAMSAINGTDFQKESAPPTMGKNYAMGGMIEGPRHSQGGVPLEAEGGEAIMTRGAVTAFAPLLSTLNQMGGGTSFSQGAVGQAGYDFPQTQSQDIQAPQITKTYVVENELTTMQQRQARLKDLSIL